ncbi:hypothetical protein L1887_01369 [Cichorium endivia]|nr:hypothetical protein L1887_01369 [Cichorium endivia]
MRSCLSGESRSPHPNSPNPTFGIKKRRNAKKKTSRSSSFNSQREEHLHRIPGRMFLNGSSQAASLFTQQGKKGTNQDAMIVWENFGSRTDTVFCGVFDGHGPFGHMVAKRVRDSLPLKLSAHWDANTKGSNDVLREVTLNEEVRLTADNSIDHEINKNPEKLQALKAGLPMGRPCLKDTFLKAFKVMDRELRMYANIDCFCSGTGAVTLIKQTDPALGITLHPFAYHPFFPCWNKIMDPNLLYDQFWQQLASCNNITAEYLSSLRILVYRSYWQNRFSEPFPWIGAYIALASLFCILAMAANLLHGLKNRKLWFPCKYFTLNAASLTVIAVAIKLPMDLTNQTQTAKLGSLAFMCTMMANLLPSLATMDSKELVSNLIALGVLVITLVVNVCIQISTKAFSYRVDENSFNENGVYAGNAPAFSPKMDDYVMVAIIYVVFLLMLLVLYACTSLAIVKSKQILESKYQSALKDQAQQQED